MNFEEKIQSLEINPDQNYTFISPTIIQGGFFLVNGSESLELCRNLSRNTNDFANSISDRLIRYANRDGRESQKEIKLYLVICETLNELTKELKDPFQFIQDNKERLVAIYEYRDLIGYTESGEKVYSKYNQKYFNLAQLLETLENNGIKWEIDTTYRDYFDPSTKFVFSYCLKKEKDEEEGYQFKKIHK